MGKNSVQGRTSNKRKLYVIEPVIVLLSPRAANVIYSEKHRIKLTQRN